MVVARCSESSEYRQPLQMGPLPAHDLTVSGHILMRCHLATAMTAGLAA